MSNPSKMSRTATLVEGAMMVALSYALSLIPLFSMPLGGSVSFFATLPLLVFSLRHSVKWGVGTALVYGFLQMMLGLSNVMYLQTIGGMVLCATMDYVLAYACLGLTGGIARRFKHPALGVGVGIGITGLMRLACSFVAGVTIWAPYTPEGWNVAAWSISYNAGWCVPDVLMVLVAGVLLSFVKVLGLVPETGKGTTARTGEA